MSKLKQTNTRRIISFFLLLALFAFPSIVTAQKTENSAPAIVKIDGTAPHVTVFRNSSFKSPIIIESAEEAAKYFSKQSVAKLTAKVDFEKQTVLLFAWRGSGGDRLSYTVAESYPEQIRFKYQPGRTRDLRPHVYVYALRNNVTWK